MIHTTVNAAPDHPPINMYLDYGDVRVYGLVSTNYIEHRLSMHIYFLRVNASQATITNRIDFKTITVCKRMVIL